MIARNWIVSFTIMLLLPLISTDSTFMRSSLDVITRKVIFPFSSVMLNSSASTWAPLHDEFSGLLNAVNSLLLLAPGKGMYA